MALDPPLLHDEAHGLQNGLKEILHISMSVSRGLLSISPGPVKPPGSKRTLTTLQVETGELSSDLVSCRSVLRVINNLHGPVMWDCQLSSNLDTCRCVLCGIYYLHCPFL